MDERIFKTKGNKTQRQYQPLTTKQQQQQLYKHIHNQPSKQLVCVSVQFYTYIYILARRAGYDP